MPSSRSLWLPAAAALLPCAFIGALGYQWIALEREASARRSADAAQAAIGSVRREIIERLRETTAAAGRALAPVPPHQPPLGRPPGLPPAVAAAFLFGVLRGESRQGGDARAEALLESARDALRAGKPVEAERAAGEIFRCCAGARDELGVAYVWYAAWQRLAAAGVGGAKTDALTGELMVLADRGYLGTSDDLGQAELLQRKANHASAGGLMTAIERAHTRVTRDLQLRTQAERWGSRLELPVDGTPVVGTMSDGAASMLAAAARSSADRWIVILPRAEAIHEWVRARPPGAFEVRVEDVASLALGARPLAGDPAADRGRQQLFVGAIGGALLLTLLAGYLTVRDISRERRTAALRTAFVAGVTHDLKTPLASIRLLAETLRRDRVQPEARDELLETIVEESDRLGGLIDNVLAASKIESGTQIYSARRVAVAPLVQSAIRRFEPILRASGFALETRIGDEDLCVHVDPTAMEHCVLNLLSNAVKYSGSSRAIRVTALRSDTHVEISVSDHGIGVPPGEQAKIFERFYRTREAAEATTGVGLGLSLVRHFADAHSGRVTLHSRPGEGSVFTIWLPVAGRHG